jgi:putative heme-binding domain-containing protein
MKSFIYATGFTLAICLIYIFIAAIITDISGGAKSAATAVGVSAEAGEAIFWGKGKCHTCHSLGERGSAIRAPNLGVSGDDFPLPMGLRAAERAKEMSQKTGKPMTAVDYLVQTHLDPGAYVVEGYKNEMPIVWKPPIALKTDEILAVDLYLLSQGGDPDVNALMGSPYFAELKKKAESAATATPVAFKPYLPGDPEKGNALFFDVEGKVACAKCHIVGDKGGKVGPELTNVAGTRELPYIIESILEPSAVIVSGFEPYLIVTNDEEFITGIKKAEDDKSITLMTPEGETISISKDNIQKAVPQKTSLMPGNFRELLTIEEFHDLVAFLQTLQ